VEDNYCFRDGISYFKMFFTPVLSPSWVGKDSGSNEVASYSDDDDDLIRSLRAQMTSFTEDNSPVKDLNCSLEQQLVNLEVDNSLNLIENNSPLSWQR